MERTGISRRGALTSAASLGVALPVLAACGEDEPESVSDSSTRSPSASDTPQESETTAPETEATEKTEEPPEGGGGGIASAADVPVGGGLILAKEQLVITQPTKGEFKGFTAICTHAGCTVNAVTDTINCPCHGSMYSIEDGSVVGGPAPSGLAAKELVVESGSINLA
jgi:Rieske Fe-S protein